MADEFMIVAGMPQTIGEEHVTEVAAMALDILAACLVFQVPRVTTCHVYRVTRHVYQVPHKPNKSISLRMGFHRYSRSIHKNICSSSRPKTCVDIYFAHLSY